tara:strand:+ start:1463 stop:1690 length:228 start_codon:yes stop_codon:yes gene_type:complete
MAFQDENTGISFGSDGISWGDWSYTWGEEPEVYEEEDPEDDRIVAFEDWQSEGMKFSPWLLLGLGGIAFLLLRRK